MGRQRWREPRFDSPLKILKGKDQFSLDLLKGGWSVSVSNFIADANQLFTSSTSIISF